jgi:hypothetical protein
MSRSLLIALSARPRRTLLEDYHDPADTYIVAVEEGFFDR